MSTKEKEVDKSRRRFLLATTSIVGAVGVAGIATPFIKSWNPSAKAKAAGAPVKVNIEKLEAGQQIIIEWRGKPVFVVRRTSSMLETLNTVEPKLRDPNSQASEQPNYAKNQHRSINEQILVLVGLCTHLGCSPKFMPEVQPMSFDSQWQGGFYCPCHGSKFDLAGRVLKGVPAPTNLVVPPYSFESDALLVIGVDQETA